METTGTISDTQFGFRKRRSTIDAIGRLQTIVREAGKIVGHGKHLM